MLNIPPITKELQNLKKKKKQQTNKTYTDLNIKKYLKKIKNYN